MNEDSTAHGQTSGEEQAYEGAGRTLQRAIRVCQASRGTIPADKTGDQARGRAAQQAAKNALSRVVFPAEEQALLVWAKRENLLLSPKAFDRNWKAMGSMGGAEHDIYYDERVGKWFKKNNLSYHASYLEYFHRLAYHNMLFPEAPIELVGFVWDPQAEWRKLCPIVSQKHVAVDEDGELVSRKEVANYLAPLGYYPASPNSDDYVNPETGIRLEDLHDENVLRGAGGELYFIDPVIYTYNPAEGGEEHGTVPAGSPVTLIRNLEAAVG